MSTAVQEFASQLAQVVEPTSTLPQISVNVRSFGAIGDGVHDDLPAIRSAIAAASAIEGSSNGVVEFPPGLYRVTDCVLLGFDTTPRATGLILRGATGSSTSAMASFLIYDGQDTSKSIIQCFASGVSIENLHITAAAGRHAYSAIDFSQQSVYAATAMRIRGCKFTSGDSYVKVSGSLSKGVTIGHLSPQANNLEYVHVSDCAFVSLPVGFHIETITGQSKHNIFERTSFNRFDSRTDAIGVLSQVGSCSFLSCTFGGLKTAVKGCFIDSMLISNVDSEHCEQLLDIWSAHSFNSTVPVTLMSGRMAPEDSTLPFIDLAAVQFTITGCSFVTQPTPRDFKIRASYQSRVISTGCWFPNDNPLELLDYAVWLSRGDMAVVAGQTYSTMPLPARD